MNPVVALALVVGAIACVAAGGWADIVLVALASALIAPRLPALSLSDLGRTVWRLRFFYLSLVVLYGWFSPGEPVLPALGALSPSVSGLVTAGRYIAVLMVITTAVQLLMAAFTREALVAALRWWLRPLRPLGLDPDRVALRLVLVADVLPRLRDLARAGPGTQPGERGLAAIARRAAAVFEKTLAEAETVPPPRLELDTIATPPPRDWLMAVLALALLVGV